MSVEETPYCLTREEWGEVYQILGLFRNKLVEGMAGLSSEQCLMLEQSIQRVVKMQAHIDGKLEASDAPMFSLEDVWG